jgi:hypothetical protein
LQLLAFRGFDQAQAVLPRRGNRWQFVPGQVPDKIDPSRLFHGEVYALRQPAHLGRAGKILRQDYIVWTVFNVDWKK